MDEFLVTLDSITMPDKFMLHGLRKAILNGYKHATFQPDYENRYYPLRENPDEIFITPALLRHNYYQLEYLLEQVTSGNLHVWEHSTHDLNSVVVKHYCSLFQPLPIPLNVSFKL